MKYRVELSVRVIPVKQDGCAYIDTGRSHLLPAFSVGVADTKEESTTALRGRIYDALMGEFDEQYGVGSDDPDDA